MASGGDGGMSAMPGVRWQYCDTSGESLTDADGNPVHLWDPFDDAACHVMEDAFSRGLNSVKITTVGAGRSYDIDFDEMTQTNIQTGFSREIRRYTEQAPEQWEWLDDSHTWRAYDASSSDTLRLCNEHGRAQVILHLATPALVAFEVDLTALTQCNAHGGMARSVRIATSGAAPIAATSATSATTSGARAAKKARTSASAPLTLTLPKNAGGFFRPAQAHRQRGLGCWHDGGDCEGGASAKMASRRYAFYRCGSHFMHAACIKAVFHRCSPKCPTCNRWYGAAMGDQPDGTMTITRTDMDCSGYSNAGTIVMTYDIPDGVRPQAPPAPGRPFTGAKRVAYLPDMPEGREILELLKRAFEHRLLFTVRTSLTTGISNMVVWASIHQKTRMDGGATAFGCPDSGYFLRVKQELKAAGIH
ncbi:hypothetical protein JKP88DRAFT_255718 [Tribonema minus]|uniref:RING-type E3 ubiquitin transferase n=1 Tax=Tribonema minus TaxID=303371 RepID=A0A835Z104_9STRA|nr:hypothetical protein JKP88DRAFT_255718 [Tribonema minus]